MRAARKALRGAAERPGEGVPRWRRRSYLSVSIKTEKHTLAFRQITNCKPRAPHSTNDSRLANDLNEFYCRFERQWESPETIPHDTTLQPISCSSPTKARASNLSTTSHL
ncbi:unnamed protein product [Pleuronectes platessa]|uniref:Uncharacterized protein n=1 Tax=Pleuronectes platessa TaxID=8262 RepID=A0A9N7VIS5_PLEPL|nr:unnamed protein product [Pleuronectes platessa]